MRTEALLQRRLCAEVEYRDGVEPVSEALATAGEAEDRSSIGRCLQIPFWMLRLQLQRHRAAQRVPHDSPDLRRGVESPICVLISLRPAGGSKRNLEIVPDISKAFGSFEVESVAIGEHTRIERVGLVEADAIFHLSLYGTVWT